jgi:hypothetical protein
MKAITRHPYRSAVIIAVGAALLMVAANGAVGIIGSEENPVNRLFSGVILVGVAGSLLARFRPLGMARAMYATAAALLLVAIYLAVAGHGFIPVVTLFFGGAWTVAARLFEKAIAR